MSMETVNHYSIPKKEKTENESSLFGRHFRKYLPNLEEFIVRKTLADRRRALFGKDPFLG
jgi:hypothetical protein